MAVTARMMHLTMWYSGHSSFDSWWAAAHCSGSRADDVLALHELHFDTELRAIRCASMSHGRSRRDGTRP